MIRTRVTPKMSFRQLGAFFALSTLPALAQSGHTINSVDMNPGTTAPSQDMGADRRHPGKSLIKPTTGNGSEVAVDLPKEVGSATEDRKMSRKNRGKAFKKSGEKELPFSNERAPRLPTEPPLPQ